MNPTYELVPPHRGGVVTYLHGKSTTWRAVVGKPKSYDKFVNAEEQSGGYPSEDDALEAVAAAGNVVGCKTDENPVFDIYDDPANYLPR
jgi:hypothetical protein